MVKIALGIANVVISFVFCSNKDAVANEHSRKVYADLDAVQTAVVSSSLGPDLHAEVIVPLAEEPVGAPTIMQWEYLDPNTVRTYDIPIHITATPADYTFESLTGLPQGFTPLQQFPYNNSISSQPPPPQRETCLYIFWDYSRTCRHLWTDMHLTYLLDTLA